MKTVTDFEFITQPFVHQQEIWDRSKDEEYFAIFAEQGTGKTKMTIDTARWLYAKGEINGVLVLAPNGVHTNWVNNEIPVHASMEEATRLAWNGNMTKTWERLFKSMLQMPQLVWLCANIECTRSATARKILETFLSSRRCLMVVDESSKIKNPKTIQARQAIRLGEKAAFRRILTGTPITQGPLDLWSQVRFLSPCAWQYRSYTAFRSMFAIDEQMTLGSRSFRKTVGYRNLDRLAEELSGFSARVTKDECLDLPEKIYSQRYVELSPEQLRIYKSLRDTAAATLLEEEKVQGTVSATSVLTVLLRLYQVVCGFVKTDDEAIRPIKNDREDALIDIIEDGSGKFVIWAYFRWNLMTIADRLRRKYGPESVVTYYGDTTGAERDEAINRFQNDPDCRFFLSNQAGSMGLTLTAAATAIYYNNSYSLETRLQSEDRIHRIGQTKHPLYIDIVTPGTVDEHVLGLLKKKEEIAGEVLTKGWRDLL